MEQPRDRLVRYLDDALAAENGIAEALTSYLKDTKNASAHSVLEEHLMGTKAQAVRIETRLRELGGKPSGGKTFFNTVVAKVSDLLQAGHDDYDRTTQDLIKAYGTEHLEIGMFAALATFAHAYGDQDTARLAEDIMSEAQQSAEKLRPLIAEAASETFKASMQTAA